MDHILIKHSGTGVEIEASDGLNEKETDSAVDNKVKILLSALMGGAHSYNWIRKFSTSKITAYRKIA